jgi:type II secretory ATPase GspE/PulE/Tfp pilus assembly ATPase PilB-like protein
MNQEKPVHEQMWLKVGLLLSGGLGVMEAFAAAAADRDGSTAAAEIQAVLADVREGIRLHDAMERRPNLFGPEIARMVGVGLSSGKLEATIQRIADGVGRGILVPPGPVGDGEPSPAPAELPVWATFETLITAAVDEGASTIHLEGTAEGGAVRFRIDDRLVGRTTVDPAPYRRLMARIKTLSCLDLLEESLPQDGQMKLRVREADVTVAITTIPTNHSESATLRITRTTAAGPEDPAATGFGSDEIRQQVLKFTRSNKGIVIVAGAPRSGKTATIRAILSSLATSQRKICSAEDPMEGPLVSVQQVRARPWKGLTLAAILRTVRRADVDVVHCSAVRDYETLECMLRLAPGCLVLGQFWADDAFDVVRRLKDIGVEDHELAWNLSGVLWQTRLPQLCGACRRHSDPDAGFEPVGCAECIDGFRGTVLVQEWLPITASLRRMLRSAPDRAALEAAAREGGFVSAQDRIEGLVKTGLVPRHRY